MSQPGAEGLDDRCPYPPPGSLGLHRLPSVHAQASPRHRHPRARAAGAGEGRPPAEPAAGDRRLTMPAAPPVRNRKRERWATALKEGQLATIRRARVELSQSIRPQLEQVRAAVAARRDPFDRAGREEARLAWARRSDAFAEFVDAHTRLFEAAGIEVEAIQRCFVDAMAEFGNRQLGAGVAVGGVDSLPLPAADRRLLQARPCARRRRDGDPAELVPLTELR